MASEAAISPSANGAGAHEETAFLRPVDRPRGPVMRLVYWYSRRQWGKVPRPFSVFCARMPAAFASFFGRVSKLDRKLTLPAETATLIRARVAGLNMCLWCVDGQRWFVANKTPEQLPRLDALEDYRTSPLFSDRDRAALDFAGELTEHRRLEPDTFAALARHYSEREICEIVWLISSEHLYNINNIGLGIGSDGLCEVAQRTR